jgi:uncharacterized protein YoxC
MKADVDLVRLSRAACISGAVRWRCVTLDNLIKTIISPEPRPTHDFVVNKTMAEVIGVASSVAGLMTLADVVVRRGYKFIKDVREADETVRKIVEEVNNLSGVLHSLSNVVERLEEEDSHHDPSTQIHYIESCYQTLTKLRGLFDEAVPEVPLSKSEKFRWPLKKPHTKELLVQIERHKATMTLAMSARECIRLLTS